MEEFLEGLVLRLRTALGTNSVYGGMEAPQGKTGNYVMVWELANRRLYSHSGKLPLIDARYNIDCYVKNAEDGKVLLKGIEASIADFSGVLNGVSVSSIKLVDQFDSEYRPELGYHVSTADYSAQYYEI